MDQEKKSLPSAILSGIGPMFWVSLVALLVFSYGAAKLNWTVNRSYMWSLTAFIFSVFYYPYYAFFQAPSPMVSTVLQAVGGRRR
jgi:hypothetical protein